MDVNECRRFRKYVLQNSEEISRNLVLLFNKVFYRVNHRVLLFAVSTDDVFMNSPALQANGKRESER